jgi:hypothetical protein
MQTIVILMSHTDIYYKSALDVKIKRYSFKGVGI